MHTTSEFIQTNGIKIHIERTGGNKTPVLLCHGITDNGRCMLRLAEHLSTNYDVILVDARGHGLSDAPEDGYSSDDHADDLYGLIKDLRLEYPIVYGHSMGARTTVRLAAKYPDLLSAIILEDPVYILPLSKTEKAARAQWRQQFTDEIRQRKTLSTEKLFQIAKEQNHADWTQSEQLEWAKSKKQVSPLVSKVGHTMGSIIDDFPLLACPVLILKADTDKKTQQNNIEAVGQIPRAQIIHISGAGHSVRRDNWTDTIYYLDEFLVSL